MLIHVPYLSFIVTILLAYWPRTIAAREMSRLPGGYDNHDPRGQQSRLEGVGRRALSAHQNSLEALPMFGIAVLAALQRSVDIRWVAASCFIFLAARVVFVLAYLYDQATLRSAMFTVGAAACIVLCGLAAFPGA